MRLVPATVFVSVRSPTGFITHAAHQSISTRYGIPSSTSWLGVCAGACARRMQLLTGYCFGIAVGWVAAARVPGWHHASAVFHHDWRHTIALSRAPCSVLHETFPAAVSPSDWYVSGRIDHLNPFPSKLLEVWQRQPFAEVSTGNYVFIRICTCQDCCPRV